MYINYANYRTSSLLKEEKSSASARVSIIEIVEKLKPVKFYSNFKEDSLQIKRDQSNKKGVYCLFNITNGKFYIGSSVNLAIRMSNYLNISFLKQAKNKNMPIVQALLKYGQDKFSLIIVEYVSSNHHAVKEGVLALRETYYITLLNPHYNVLKQGFSSLGYKHTEETKKLLSELATARKHSINTKSLISKAFIGKNNPFYKKSHSINTKLRMIKANRTHPVFIYNSYKELLIILPSVKTFAKLIKSNHSTIVKFIKSGELFRGEWYISNIPLSLINATKQLPLIKFTGVMLGSINKTSGLYLASLSEERNFYNLISEIINSAHIKKAIFVYKKYLIDGTLIFIRKFEGVTQLEKE